MRDQNDIEKPINRKKIRRTVGREFYILKRKLNWYFGNQKLTNQVDYELDGNIVFRHKSLILRPLKDVDMYLQENKRVNLQLAVQKLNNTILNPFETFSLWKQVGRPTSRKGYLEGLILNQGSIEKGVGGGLCQLGNLLFWIFAHSPLTITERHRHGFDVFPDVNRKVPFGAGATLSYNYIDLQVINNTENQFQIKLWLDNEFLHGELIAKDRIDSIYEVEERNHLIKQQIWGGYTRHNQIFRVENDYNGRKHESLLVENHAILMYNPFLSANNN
jgi:vancomycin resistance protein VanW